MNQVDENIIEFLKIGRYTFISERKWSNAVILSSLQL